MIRGKVKRFALFHGDNYYPCGGPRDFAGSFDSIEEAREVAVRGMGCCEWCIIWDIETGETIDIDVSDDQ